MHRDCIKYAEQAQKAGALIYPEEITDLYNAIEAHTFYGIVTAWLFGYECGRRNQMRTNKAGRYTA